MLKTNREGDMRMKRGKLWLILVGILLTASVLAVVYWQTLIVYLAPKMVLAGALKDRVADIESRLSSGPVSVLMKGIDPAGNHQIDLQLDTDNELLGSIRYDMQVQLAQNPRRILADGSVSFGKIRRDLSFYLDGTFAAVRSPGILGDCFYGLEYATFSENLQSNQLLGLLIGTKALTKLESAVLTLQTVMQQTVPELPDISEVDLDSLVMGILAMDVDVERVETDLNGENQDFFVISFAATGTDIASGMQYLKLDLPNMPAGDAQIKFSFWLKERQLCKLEAEADGWSLNLYWGSAPVSFLAEDDIYIEYYDGSAFKTCKVHTEQHENLYRENVTYVGEETIQLAYDWVASTGSLKLTAETKGERSLLSMKLKPLENGFFMETDDFGGLMHLLTGAPDAGDNPCTVKFSKGTDFQTPEYKTFELWSMEELLALFSEFGSLFGLER